MSEDLNKKPPAKDSVESDSCDLAGMMQETISVDSLLRMDFEELGMDFSSEREARILEVLVQPEEILAEEADVSQESLSDRVKSVMESSVEKGTVQPQALEKFIRAFEDYPDSWTFKVLKHMLITQPGTFEPEGGVLNLLVEGFATCHVPIVPTFSPAPPQEAKKSPKRGPYAEKPYSLVVDSKTQASPEDTESVLVFEGNVEKPGVTRELSAKPSSKKRPPPVNLKDYAADAP